MAAEVDYAAVPISITVNGVKHDAIVEPRTLLVYFLREHLGLTGTHVGCDTSQCGACTVHLLETNPNPTDAEIKHALEGNLCRCTGYVNIVEAIKWAAARMQAAKQ